MRVCYFGTYEKAYPRNAIFVEGLKQNGVTVFECHAPLWEKTQSKGKDFGFSLSFLFSVIIAQAKLLFQYLFLTPKHDVIIVGYIGQLDIYLAKILAYICRKKLVFNPLISLYDTVIADRGYFETTSLKSRLFRFLDMSACKLSDLVLLDTAAHIQYFQNQLELKEVNFKRIPVGADDRIFFPISSESHDKFHVMFIGKFIPLHGIEKLVEAAYILKTEDEIKFTFIGTGQLRDSIETNIRKRNLENVQMVDWVPYYKLSEKMSEADLILGIFGDSDKAKRVIPNKVYQGLAVNRPVLTAETDAINELLISDEHIFSCEATPTTIADKIVSIYKNTSHREKVATKGYQFFLDHLSVEKLGAELKECLYSI